MLTSSLLLQSADAYEEMRNLQLAQAEYEDDDDANPTPDPALWRSSSPHDTLPYPSTPSIIESISSVAFPKS